MSGKKKKKEETLNDKILANMRAKANASSGKEEEPVKELTEGEKDVSFPSTQ